MESLGNGDYSRWEYGGYSRWKYDETIEKGLYATTNGVAYRPFCCIRDIGGWRHTGWRPKSSSPITFALPFGQRFSIPLRPVTVGSGRVGQTRQSRQASRRIPNPQSLNRLRHFLTPDCKSDGTPELQIGQQVFNILIRHVGNLALVVNGQQGYFHTFRIY